MLLKKLVIASAAALALGGASLAHAADVITFDRNGAAAGGAVSVTTFDWLPGNSLAIGALSTLPDDAGNVLFQVVSQGKLGLFVNQDTEQTWGPLDDAEFTFQASFHESATGIGAGNANFSLGAGGGTFSVYYDPANNSNSITGLGYGDGLLILSGTFRTLTGTFADDDVANGTACGLTGIGCELLDQSGAGDNQNGVLTHKGNGSTTIEVDVTFADSSFFVTDITQLLIDLQDTTNNAIPFESTNPSDQVFGVTPVYSRVADGEGGFLLINGAACTAGGSTESGTAVLPQCDIHLQTDASTSFNVAQRVPEPGTLAMAGLALGLLGFAGRRRKQA
jgi:hypothetical protein